LRSGQELLQGEELARLARLLLTVDLLQTEDVGVHAHELRAHQLDAGRQRRGLIGLVIEVLEVEGADADGGHGGLLSLRAAGLPRRRHGTTTSGWAL